MTADGITLDNTDRGEERGCSSFRALADASPDAISILDLERRPVYMNAAGLKMHEIASLAELEGVDIGELFFSEDRECLLKGLSAEPQWNGKPEVEVRIRTFRTGQPLWVSYTAFPLRDRENKVTSLGTTARKIILKRAEIEVLRKSERWSRMAIECSHFGTWKLDLLTWQVSRSERYDEIFGYEASAAPWTFAQFVEYVVPEERDRIKVEFQSTAAERRDFEFETRIFRPDGEVRWIWAKGQYFAESHRTADYLVGLIADVTEHKRADALLRQSEKLLVIGRMASSISHELNNPLEAVTNLVYLARLHSDLPEVRGYLDGANLELQRMSNIANNSYRFHDQASRPLGASCSRMFLTVLTSYATRLRNANIQIEERKCAEDYVSCFQEDIIQVLNNIVANAIDAMPNGGRLLLRCRKATDWSTSRPGMELTVADTGCGMSKATRARAFEAFFSTKGISGLGIGLWICDAIVERHQGRLLLRTKNRGRVRGTVMTLFLPFETSTMPAGAGRTQQDLPSAPLSSWETSKQEEVW